MSTTPLSLRESPPAELARRWAYPPAYLRILAVQMAFGLSYSAFLLLPKYLRLELGANAQDIGAVAGAAVVAAAVLAPFIGLSARWVSRRLLVGCALILAGLAGATFTLVPGLGPLMYLIRVLQGVAWIIVFQCTATMVADLVPKERLSQAIGFLGVAMLATNALAPAVVEPIADRLGCGIGVMFTFTQPYALSLGATRVGDFFFGYVAMAMFVRLGLSNLADRVGPARVATFSMILYAVVVGSAAWLEPHLLVLAGLGLGACHGLMYPALMATGMADLRPEERPVFMGWTSLAFNGGSAATVLCLGPVADRYGYPVIFWTVGALIATGILPLAITRGVIGKRHLRLDRLE